MSSAPDALAGHLLPADFHALEAVVRSRWSPYVYAEQPIATEDLRAVFEIARHAPSSFNEQPWRFVLGVQGDETWTRIHTLLKEANAAWAQRAPVLGVAFVQTTFSRNDRPNRHARHDLGAALAYLGLAAAGRGLGLHVMAGFDAEAAPKALGAPEGFEAVTAFALGYPAPTDSAPEVDEALAQKDAKRRGRRPLEETVFSAAWGEAPTWTEEPRPS